jgi:radical SAM protein with 4Fe4S-binding SPASM domain
VAVVDTVVLAPVRAPAAPAPAQEVVDKHLLSLCVLKGFMNWVSSLTNKSRNGSGANVSNLLSPGLYHYLHDEWGERSRVHLRIDPDGNALLFVNASRIMHLNLSATLMARLALEGSTETEAIRELKSKFLVNRQQAKYDYAQFRSKLKDLLKPDGPCPVHDLMLDVAPPFSSRPSAPYRMDLALTYRCNNDCTHCYNGRPRNYPEMDTDQWKFVLDKLWQLGIPHIVFTGGEPTLRHDLPELIAHAQMLGQITGLNTNGRRLSDVNFLSQLVDAGLDHVQITVESHDPSIHDQIVDCHGAWNQTIAGLKNVLKSSLFVMTNTTMLQDNSPFMEETLHFFASLGVPTIGLNALIYAGHGVTVGTGLRESDLSPLLDLAQKITDTNNQRLIWYTPTEYCNFDPMQLELGIKGCTAALYNMCIEPDGGVIPCQSYYQQLGNISFDTWDSIWNHKLAISLRERQYVLKKCNDCVLLNECGGGCPLKLPIS